MALEYADRETLRSHQIGRLNQLLADVLPRNRFYADRLRGLTPPLSWGDFASLPLLTKAELVEDQASHPPFGRILTYPEQDYIAYHQTSGTSGRPLKVIDTAASWRWWQECWRYVYAGAGVTAADRIFVAFGFGPFIGFWSAFESARAMGALLIPGGNMDTARRLEAIREQQATVVLCTPTYALHMLEQARGQGIDLAASKVRVTIHAGEPGASIPSVRQRIEEGWGARCYDHAGATEVGAFGYMCECQAGLHLNEAEFIAEIVDPVSGRPVAEGEEGELVLTGLGRAGWPVIRYRTRDRVRHGGRACACGRTTLFLPGGILGRADDMLIIRGVNVYPSAIEAIVRERPELGEFRMLITRAGTLDALTLEVEVEAEPCAAQLAHTLYQRLNLRVVVTAVPPGTLPRWEQKARRLVDLRQAAAEQTDAPQVSLAALTAAR
ncbi:MAG: phenylacetate--CoA ligase [Chloroflexales bacterium]|nr:phenylacetate--CoA ligase [Chloroflexales bacterium]